MTRLEHVAWCKERAIAEMDFSHDPKQAVISMMSDLRKHEETNQASLIGLCTMVLLSGQIKTRQDALKFINGFN